MEYLCTEKTETIFMHDDGCSDNMHCIMITQSGEEPTFCVNCCCNAHWEWKFLMDNVSNYEMVKHVIMDTMLGCRDIGSALNALDEQFELIFNDIVVWDKDECQCDGSCCENCNHRDCLD